MVSSNRRHKMLRSATIAAPADSLFHGSPIFVQRLSDPRLRAGVGPLARGNPEGE